MQPYQYKNLAIAGWLFFVFSFVFLLYREFDRSYVCIEKFSQPIRQQPLKRTLVEGITPSPAYFYVGQWSLLAPRHTVALVHHRGAS